MLGTGRAARHGFATVAKGAERLGSSLARLGRGAHCWPAVGGRGDPTSLPTASTQICYFLDIPQEPNGHYHRREAQRPLESLCFWNVNST